jgi:hypothetical protein
MNFKRLSVLASVGLAAFLSSAQTAPALGTAVAPDLKTAGTYTLLGTNSSATVGTLTCTTSTINNGNLGTTFGSYTDTGPCTLTGTAAFVTSVPNSVVTDFDNAYSALNTLNPVCDTTIPTSSTSLPPGVYCSTAATTFTGAVTFTLSGSATDVWVFKVGTGGLGALTGTGFSVVMGGTAQACNVWWWTRQAATMTDSSFIGTILSGDAISLTRGDLVGRALATTDVTVTDVQPITFAGCAPPSTITVNKNYVGAAGPDVQVDLTCDSGIVTPASQNANEGSPAEFAVGGATLGATCDATETTAPTGYTSNEANCVDVPLNGSCTIINTQANLTTITVYKDFSPDSPAPVSVSVTCDSGVVAPLSQNASEGSPAVFTVTGTSSATCTATEAVPDGYTADQTDCSNMALTPNGNSSCTIINRLDSDAIVVYKDFIPNNGAAVSVTLTCDSGTVIPTSQNASEGAPAVFEVTGTVSATCTATEVVPNGYTADQTDCSSVGLSETCTIFNALIPLPPVTAVPALSGRAMIVLVALLALLGLAAIRRFTT